MKLKLSNCKATIKRDELPEMIVNANEVYDYLKQTNIDTSDIERDIHILQYQYEKNIK